MAFETTDFEDVLREAAGEVTALNPENLDVNEFRALRRAAKRRLEIAWEYHYWPVLARTEQRFFAADYNNATAYAVGAFIYFPATQKYYQNLAAGTIGAPPDINPNVWPEAETSYSAEEYNLTAQYEEAERAEYGGNVYQVFNGPALAGDLPTEATIWGLLVPFDKYVPYEQAGETALGLVAAAWSVNPKTTTRGHELNWSLSENGVQVHTAINFAWLEYRLRCPKLSGDLFDATAIYTSGQQIYFSSANTPGNFYIANATTTAGQSPDTTAAKWEVVPLPRLFHKYLVHGVAADWLRGPGGGDAQDVALQMQYADAALEDQKSLLVGQQSQRIKTVVRTR